MTDELGREYWKPHELSYMLMAEKLEVDFDEIIFVGDNVSKDFITANKLGIKTVQIKRQKGIYIFINGSHDYCAHYVISDFSELISIVEFKY
jgi:putative hydrolase of the HAD superfamily